ncbi:ferrous iron transport protein A [Chryseobacterium scophthalmum]|uniref:Ferrous iron transport protein A n=1 Tax=Chryseobacterium scophthalmum TaxID=59733 RepID=A0A1N6HBL3_9FLAO|nr:ferrous iron transport protein A [Chryseobacterium scophthalmum]
MQSQKIRVLKDIQLHTLSSFPKNKIGKIVDYDNDNLKMPTKIIEMGLLPETLFKILYQAPFNGPLYIEFGDEKSRIALRKEEGDFIIVEDLINAGK